VLVLCLAALGPAGSAGAVTPGEVTGFEVPGVCYPGAIAVAPKEGVVLRQCETKPPDYQLEGTELATLLPGGAIEKRTIPPSASGPMLAGPAGELWLAVDPPIFENGAIAVERLDPDGTSRRFPLTAPNRGRRPRVVGLALGAEGAIWGVREDGVARIVPGAPGLDAWGVVARPRAHTVSIRLVCGGSAGGCEGELKVSMPTYQFAYTAYAVPAEAARTLTFKVPAKAFALWAGEGPKRRRLTVRVQATVAGGPELKRRVKVPAPPQAS